MDGIFDLGGYYKKVLERSAQMITLQLNYASDRITPIILYYKVALFTQFKFYFSDIEASSIVIFNKHVRPVGDHMDLHELIQLTTDRLATFI